MQKKYQVFISSTYMDLKAERDAVRDAVLRIHHFPVGMEQFNAEDKKQWQIIKEAIDLSDYYVLIIGKRYGSVIETGEEVGISYTEKEFRYAVSQGIPVLAFIKSGEAMYRSSDLEEDNEKNAKLQCFVEEVKKNRLVEWFSNSYELATKVTAALHNVIEKKERPGWIRGNVSEIDCKVDELVELLKCYLDYGEKETDNVLDDLEEPVIDYEFERPRFPADGKHKEIGWNGNAIGEGEYKDGKLMTGIEYDVLIHVVEGKLIHKPDCPEDPYDSSEDFKYERMESYGWGLSPFSFGASENYIIEDGIDEYYVVDFKVNETTERMTNIRTLREFLSEKNPQRLEHLCEMIKMRDR